MFRASYYLWMISIVSLEMKWDLYQALYSCMKKITFWKVFLRTSCAHVIHIPARWDIITIFDLFSANQQINSSLPYISISGSFPQHLKCIWHKTCFLTYIPFCFITYFQLGQLQKESRQISVFLLPCVPIWLAGSLYNWLRFRAYLKGEANK